MHECRAEQLSLSWRKPSARASTSEATRLPKGSLEEDVDLVYGRQWHMAYALVCDDGHFVVRIATK